MMRKEFDGDRLDRNIKELPKGGPMMAGLLDAIRQADEAKDAYWQLYFRYKYACEATFRDDPPKAIPVAAEFAGIFEENPNALPENVGAEAYVMITQLGIDPIVNLPQISKKQWEEMMDRYYDLVKRFHMGYRTYWWQLTQFWQYVDKEKAFEYFQKFWETERDDLSDCRQCEQSYAVRMSLMMGDEKAAEEYGKSLKEGNIFFCSDNPQRYWQYMIDYAMNKGDLKTAAPLANKLARKGSRDRSDLSYMGAALRCFAYTNMDQGISLLKKGMEWTIGMWDQRKCYDFYKGAYVYCKELSKENHTVELALSKEAGCYQKNGIYNCSDLAEWFYRQAEEIGKRFDKRNQSDYFAKDLALACACETSGCEIANQQIEVLISSVSPVCPQEAFVESDGKTCYFYMVRFPNTPEQMIASCFVCNLVDESRIIPLEKWRENPAGTPTLPYDLVSHDKRGFLLDEDELEIIWTMEGSGAALLYEGELLAFLPEWIFAAEFPGYSRYIIGETPFGVEMSQAMDYLEEVVEAGRDFWESMEEDF